MTNKKTSTEAPVGNEEPPGLDDLARQYVDLWQQQLSGAASDEALAEVMAQTVQLMNAGAATMASFSSLQQTPVKDDNNDHNGKTNDAGASTVTSASGTDNTVVDELHRRIEQLEERIAALEAGADDKRA